MLSHSIARYYSLLTQQIATFLSHLLSISSTGKLVSWLTFGWGGGFGRARSSVTTRLPIAMIVTTLNGNPRDSITCCRMLLFWCIEVRGLFGV